MSINWYMNIYYKYRDYPANYINIKYKPNQLKNIYANIFARLSLYFYIDTHDQFSDINQDPHPPSIQQIKSNKRTNNNHSSACVSFNSKFFQSHKKLLDSGKLKNQIINFSIENNEQMSKSYASINLFKSIDSPIDEYGEQKLQNLENILKLVMSTGKQFINNILIQGQSIEQQSNEEMSVEGSNVKKVNRQSRQQKQENDRRILKEQIQIQVIPNNNQEINFFFLEFCSGVEVKKQDKNLHIESKVRFESRLDESSSSLNSLKSQLGLKNAIKPGQTKINDNLDQVILEIMSKQLQQANNYLSKFEIKQLSDSKRPESTSSHLNLILQTWLQLITMIEDEKVIYQITTQLVKGSSSQPFIQKISSYLYFISLISTKSLLAKSVSKENFLFLIPDFLQGSRSLSDLKLNKKQGFVDVHDVPLDRNLYSSQAFNNTIRRWKHVACIVSNELIKNSDLFWAKTFQQCCQLLDVYLQQKVEFAYSLLVLYESLNIQSHALSTTKTLQQYQRGIKIIIQKQIGNSSYTEYPASRAHLKSKGSINRSQRACYNNSLYKRRKDSFTWDQHEFIFYRDQSAGREDKIYQIRQWEKVIREAIARIRGYRRILDTGLSLFEGVAQFIAIFFLESYLNFQKTQIITPIDFFETVCHYCHKIQNSSILQAQKINLTITITKPLLLQLQMHKQNNRQMCRQMALTLRSRQASSKTINHNQASLNASNSALTNTLHNLQREGSSTSSSMKRFQNTEKVLQQQPDEEPIDNSFGYTDGIPVLQQDFFLNLLEKIKLKQFSEEEMINQDELNTLSEINNYLKLLNQCNFILSLLQTSQQAAPSRRPLEKANNPRKKFFLLNSSELVESLTKQQNEIKSPAQGHHIHRKTSNNNKINRMSSSVAMRKKNSVATGNANGNNKEGKNQKDSVAYTPADSCTDDNGPFCQRAFSKIRDKIESHNQYLALVILSYSKHMQYYRLLISNIQCTKCCGLAAQNPDLHIVLPSKQEIMQKGHQQLAEKKIQAHLIKYRKLNKTDSGSLQPYQKQLKQQLELNNLNNEIIMIFMYMASLKVDNQTFLAIYKQDLISEEKRNKVKVIGRAYYESIHSLYQSLHGNCCGSSENHSFQIKKDVYLQHLLLLIVAFLEFMFYRTEDGADLSSYTTLFMNYFISKASIANDNEKFKSIQELISISKIISQSFDWNQQNRPDIGEKQLIVQLLQLRTSPTSQSFAQELRIIIDKQFQVLKKYQNSSQKVQYLQKKLLYCMLRQIYFDSYYDIGIFEAKSIQARKNFAMYEQMMSNFFEQIIEKDHQQFLQRKAEQLKQRSTHLKGYLLDYEQQPQSQEEYKKCLTKIVCIFDKTLNLLTENRQFQMKKRGSNSMSLFRNNKGKKQPIYMHFVSTQYLKPNKDRVKVFDNQGYFFYRAIQIYEDMLSKKVEQGQKRYSIHRQFGFNVPLSIYVSFQDSQYQTIHQSKQSLLALWINLEYKNLHERKMILSHQNYLSKIEKLYIDLDVRHKVFESFKDKILNYQMQKTKIYHQYMDYIRGLKFDVYSHVTGEDPLPYFKLINGIKLYRLNIKKKELEEKIDEEFGKNLGKWNEGIGQDMKQYGEWVTNEMRIWQKLSEGSKRQRKQLFDIYSIVNKQLRRQQHKTIEISMKSKQNITKPHNRMLNSRKMINYNK